jgi:peptide chain release factor 1
MVSKMAGLNDRFEEVSALLSDPDVMADRDKFTGLSKEFAELEPVVLCYRQVQKIEEEIEHAKALLDEDDAEMRAMAEEEVERGSEQVETLTAELQKLLLPRDPNDHSNVFLEIRAGTGGDEAAIFSGDLLRMYTKFAEGQGWKMEILNERAGEHGGYKEVI